MDIHILISLVLPGRESIVLIYTPVMALLRKWMTGLLTYQESKVQPGQAIVVEK